jgi:hypothetical protein
MLFTAATTRKNQLKILPVTLKIIIKKKKKLIHERSSSLSINMYCYKIMLATHCSYRKFTVNFCIAYLLVLTHETMKNVTDCNTRVEKIQNSEF